MVHIVVDKLAPLHHREGEANQLTGDGFHHALADQPRARQRLASDARVPHGQQAVVESAGQEPLEAGVCAALQGALEVVTLAVRGTVPGRLTDRERFRITAGDV